MSNYLQMSERDHFFSLVKQKFSKSDGVAILTQELRQIAVMPTPPKMRMRTIHKTKIGIFLPDFVKWFGIETTPIPSIFEKKRISRCICNHDLCVNCYVLFVSSTDGYHTMDVTA